MKKITVKLLWALTIVFGLLNAIVFAIPIEKSTAFWIGYAFTVVAFVAQFGSWLLAFHRDPSLRSRFLGLSLVLVSMGYLAFQVLMLVLLTVFPFFSPRIAAVVESLLLGSFAVFMLGALINREAVDQMDNETVDKVLFLQSLLADVQLLAAAETDPESQAALTHLAETIRFSDPISSDAVAALEEEIAAKIAALGTAADKPTAAHAAELLLKKRNQYIKLPGAKERKGDR